MNRESTMQPFKKGDVLAGAAVLNDPDDDHAADGRIVQYDADLNKKGELWLSGTTYLTFGVKFDPDGMLWAFDPRPHVVVHVDPDGKQRPLRPIAERPFSNVNFAKDGSMYLAEHFVGGREAIDPETGFLINTTTKPTFLPGTDLLGEGRVFKYDAALNLVGEYDVKANGGITGYLGVTTSVLCDDDRTLLYLSETGRRVQQYDLETDQPLPDLIEYGDGPEQMVFGLALLSDNDVLVGHMDRIDRVKRETREVLRTYKLDGIGWAPITPSIDAASVYAGNFFNGDIVRLDLDSGDITARTNTGTQNTLASLVQYAG